MDDQTLRLNRIEEKLDKVGEAVISLARMEERMITLFKRMDAYDERQELLVKRVSNIEVAQATTSGSTSWTERFIWILIAGIVSGSIYLGK